MQDPEDYTLDTRQHLWPNEVLVIPNASQKTLETYVASLKTRCSFHECAIVDRPNETGYARGDQAAYLNLIGDTLIITLNGPSFEIELTRRALDPASNRPATTRKRGLKIF